MKKSNGIIGFKFFYNEKIMNASIDDLNELSQRSSNCLKRAHYLTIGDIVEHWDDLPKIKNFGSKCIKEVRSAVFNYNVERLNPDQLNKFVDNFYYNTQSKSRIKY